MVYLYSEPVLPPETASYGGGMSRWESDDDGGREADGSPAEPSSWTPYQLGQIDVCGAEAQYELNTHNQTGIGRIVHLGNQQEASEVELFS